MGMAGFRTLSAACLVVKQANAASAYSVPKTLLCKGLAGRIFQVSLKIKRAIFIGKSEISY
jgi:hypothetical protein